MQINYLVITKQFSNIILIEVNKQLMQLSQSNETGKRKRTVLDDDKFSTVAAGLGIDVNQLTSQKANHNPQLHKTAQKSSQRIQVKNQSKIAFEKSNQLGNKTDKQRQEDQSLKQILNYMSHTSIPDKNLIMSFVNAMKTAFISSGQMTQNKSQTISLLKYQTHFAGTNIDLVQISNYWSEVVNKFIHDFHPYCTKKLGNQLLQFYIEKNESMFIKESPAETQKMLRDLGVFSRQKILEPIFCKRIQRSLSNLLQILVYNYSWVVSKLQTVQQKQIEYLLQTNLNFLEAICSFKQISTIDFEVTIQLIFQLSDILMAVSYRYEKAYKKLVQRLISVVNKIFDYINQYENKKNANTNQVTLEVIRKTSKNYVMLLNYVIFKNQSVVDPEHHIIKQQMSKLNSRYLIPYQWVYFEQERKNFILDLRLYKSEWLPYVKFLLSYQKQNRKLLLNEQYQQSKFNLICSFIDEYPVYFWENSTEYEPIYNYIGQIYDKMQTRKINSPQYSSYLQKFCKLMICSIGRKNKKQKQSCVSSQLIKLIRKDSIFIEVLQLKDSSTIKNRSSDCSQQVFQTFGAIILQRAKQLTSKKLFRGLLNRLQQLTTSHNKEVINSAYNVFQELMISNSSTINSLIEIWVTESKNKESFKPQQLTMQFIWYFTFGYLQKMYQVNEKSISSNRVFQELDEENNFATVFQLINAMLNGKYRDIIAQFFIMGQVQSNHFIFKALAAMGQSVKGIQNLTNHVQALYQHNLSQISWCKKIVQIIQDNLHRHREIISRHFAIVTKTCLIKQCLSSTSILELQKVNYFKVHHRNMISSGLLAEEESKFLIKIPELTKYSDFLIQFLHWILRLEQDNSQEYSFYNPHFLNKNFETLSAGLQLLEILIICYIKYYDRIYFKQRLRRFLSICHGQDDQSSEHFLGSGSLFSPPLVEMKNKKKATLTTCLVYLFKNTCNVAKHNIRQMDKIKEVRFGVLNIINLILANSKSQERISLLNNLSQYKQSFVDLNVYQQSFVTSQNRIYHEDRGGFLKLIKAQMSKEINFVNTLSWFQNSFQFAQILDIFCQLNNKSIFDLNQLIQKRVENCYQKDRPMRKALKQFLIRKNVSEEIFTPNREQIPKELREYVCDRQVASLSRYLLYSAFFYDLDKKQSSAHFLMISNFIVKRLCNIIAETPECQSKLQIVLLISNNMWRTIRILQTKSHLKIFVNLLSSLFPFILNPYHINILDQGYKAEYIFTVNLLLSCKQYLSGTDFSQILRIKDLGSILGVLIDKCSERPQYYSVLFYCLLFQAQLPCVQASYKKHLVHVYLTINQKINPKFNENSLKKEQQNQIKYSSNELNQNLKFISLLLFLRLNIGQQIRNQKIKYQDNFLLYANLNTSSYNFQSLLFNAEGTQSEALLELALKIGRSAIHYLEFTSVCSYIYELLWSIKQTRDFSIFSNKVFKFINQIFHLTPKSGEQTQENWRNLLFMKSWACNILTLILSCSQDNQVRNYTQILFQNNRLLSILGSLLTVSGQIQAKWPFQNIKSLNDTQLSLIQKEAVLSILKVYSILLERNKSNGHQQEQILKSFMYATNLLNKLSNSHLSFERRGGINVICYNPPKNQDQEFLNKIYIEDIYLSLLKINDKQQKQKMQKILKQIHPESSTVLDVLHEHFNYLIIERHLMLLLCCLTTSSFYGQQAKLESHLQKILQVLKQACEKSKKMEKRNKETKQFYKQITSRYWKGFKTTKILYFLNCLEEEPGQINEILGNIQQLGFRCFVILKRSMSTERFKQFYGKAESSLLDIISYFQKNGVSLQKQMETLKSKTSSHMPLIK